MLNQRSFCAYCSLLHSAICALRWISFSLFTCLQWAQSIFYYFLFSVHFFKQCFQYISNECNFVVTYLHLGVDSILNHPFGTLEWRNCWGKWMLRLKSFTDALLSWMYNDRFIKMKLLIPSSFFLPLTTTHHRCPFPIRFTLNILFFALLKSRTCS